MDKKSILIVDDEPFNINIVAEILYKDYQIRVATSGKMALDILEKRRPDLILLDVVMPEMNGYEVASQLNSNPETKDIPFIFLTAKSDARSIVQGFTYGAVDYIPKPFAKEELLARVATHLKVDELQKSLSKRVNTLHTEMDEFEMIFHHSANGIGLTDLETNFILVNDTYCDMLGYSKEELLTKNYYDLIPNEELATTQEMIQKVLKDGYLGGVSKRYIGKEDIIYVTTSIALMPDKKTLLFNTVDMTKLKNAEVKIAHYQKIIDENIISIVTDFDGHIIDVSQALSDATGYAKEEFIEFYHNLRNYLDISQELWDTIIRDQHWSGETRVKTKDGGSYLVETNISEYFDERNAEMIGYKVIQKNIRAFG